MTRQETSDGDLLLVVHDVALDQRHPAPGHAGHEGGAAGPGTQLPPAGKQSGSTVLGPAVTVPCLSSAHLLFVMPKVEPALKASHPHHSMYSPVREGAGQNHSIIIIKRSISIFL